MAEIYPTQDVGRQDSSRSETGAPLGTALNVLGAAASLALIAGIGIWGYKLVMRDVSGVPVVRALEGPMRVQPEDPGWLPADHQGLAVNSVAAKGSAEAPAERLVLAPRPVDLADEDQPMQQQNPVTASVAPPLRGNENGAAVDEVKTGSVQSLVDRLIADVLPASENEAGAKVVQVAARIEQPADLPDLSGEKPAADPVELQPAVVSGPGPAQSLRPKIRPARALATEAAPKSEGREALDVDPADIAAGTRLAQLGAFESPEVARQEWDRLSGLFSDYLQGKSRVIQKASSGGRTFYRLRAMGFEDLSDARRFCSVLVAEKADCIPVVHR